MDDLKVTLLMLSYQTSPAKALVLGRELQKPCLTSWKLVTTELPFIFTVRLPLRT